MTEDERIKMLAEATLEGSFGNGIDRKKLLGKDYEKVQEMINKIIIKKEEERRRRRTIRNLKKRLQLLFKRR